MHEAQTTIKNYRAHGGNCRRPPQALAQRFFSKVDWSRVGTGCWHWTAFWNERSYGQLVVMRNGKPFAEAAHRVAWFIRHGYFPRAGMHLDHLCRDTHCVNPTHLREVTRTVNSLENNLSPFARNAAAPACKQGHLFTPENTALYKPKFRLLRRTNRRVLSDRVTRICLTCHPSWWRWAVVPRDPPPNSRPRNWKVANPQASPR